MTFVSYAQNFEDVLLWRALHDVRGGRYLDIGAQDPLIDSVSKAFYEAGWRGVHIEPTPTYAEKLREDRPDEIVIQAAVSDADQPIEFYEFPGTGLSTGKVAIADQHAAAGFARRKIVVPSIKLEHLLDAEGPDFQWVKIDVEGMEPEALRSWRKSERRPWLFVIEATYPLSQEETHEAWMKELSDRGYEEVHFDGLSRYFLHASQKGRNKAFQAPANVFDEFAITRRHFSAVSLRNELDQLEQRLKEQQSHRAELQSNLTTVQRQLAEEEQRAANSDVLAEKAQRRLEAAHAQQIATFESWVQAERQHLQHLEKLRSEHEAELERARSDREATESKLERALGSLTTLRDHQTHLSNDLRQARIEKEELQLRVAELDTRLRDADAMIEKALAAPASFWQRVGRAFGFDRQDPVRAVLLSWKSHPPPLHVPSAEPDMTMKPYLHANSLSELLSLDGKDFVGSAYATMLGREADPEGEAYYVRRLGHGIPKLQILEQMRKSPEAKLVPDPLPGLDEAFRQFRISSWFRGKKAAAEAIETRLSGQSDTAHVQQFMQYHDEEFVRVVYGYYLGRQPDGPGLDYYLNHLRHGASRQQVLVDIFNSREAKTFGRTAVGQRSVATAIALDKVPVIGTLVSILKFNFGIKRHLQDMRSLQNYVYRLAKKVG